MRTPSNRLPLLGGLILALLLAGRTPCRAVEQITCVSDKGLWTHYDLPGADRLEVKLVTQVSRSKCKKGVTWGVDGEGIWVDKGCRAVFQYQRDGRPAAAANANGAATIFSPAAGILCDREVALCYDSQGASVALTRSFFGEKAAGKLAGMLQSVPAEGGGNAFTLSNGVTCYPTDRTCKERRCEAVPRRDYSELLFGKERTAR